MAAALPPRTDSALPQPRPNPTRATSARTARAKVHLMASVTVPNPGKAAIYFQRAHTAMSERYAKMQNCKSCDQRLAEQYREAAEFFLNLQKQILEQA